MAGDWLEVSVATSSEAVEAVSEMLMDLGAGGVEIDDPRLVALARAELGPELVDEPDAAAAWRQYMRGALPQCAAEGEATAVVKAYLNPAAVSEDTLRQLAERVRGLAEMGLNPGPATVSTRLVHEEDWASAWKQFYEVQKIGRHLVVAPSWLSYTAAEGDVVITLDPGMAFGTGTHPTTRLCLAALEELVRPDFRVLDLGTGSGILAIAAAKLGATVQAIDIDAQAAKVAADNVRANGVDAHVSVSAGTLATVPANAAFDIVIANIVADTIVAILPDIPARLGPNGVFLASGIVTNRLPEVLAAWRAAGLTVDRQYSDADWVCLIGGKAR